MTRNMKTLGIALAAVFAMSAVVASAASAEYHFEAGSEPVYVTSTETNQHVFTAGGEVKCSSIAFEGEASEDTTNELTIVPSYANCEAFGLQADVTENGCHFLFTTPATKLATDEFTGESPHVVCPEGEGIEITPKLFGFPVCTVTVESHTPTSGHVIYQNSGGSGTNEMDVDVNATVEGIHYTSTGGACGESGTGGKYTGTVTLEGYSNEAHTTKTDITVSNTPTK